jgi:integrase
MGGRIKSESAFPERLRDAWKALKPVFGALRPDQVSRIVCRDYVAQRRRAGRAPGTIRKELSTLRAALRWADKNTPAIVELPAGSAPKEHHLTRPEVTKLIDGAEQFHIKLFIVLLIATGARKGAVLDLTWDRVDFQRGIIRLSSGTETRKGRATVPMTERAQTMLEQARQAALTDNVIEWAGKSVKSTRKGFDAAVLRAGLGGEVTPHVLRHTAAVWMAEGGRPMEEIAQYLGHTDVRTTYRIYARFSPNHLRQAAAFLEV